MHELEKVRKQLEVEKLELQSALEEAEVRAWLCLHPCLGAFHVPPNPAVSDPKSSSPGGDPDSKRKLLAPYS